MKAILLSVQPQWVEKILNREKTIEIRKTKPNIELPCKVYIYCSYSKRPMNLCCYSLNSGNYKLMNKEEYDKDFAFSVNGRVVAEFTLKNIVNFDIESLVFMGKEKELMQKACLGGLSLRKYLGNKIGYSWGIEDLKIYDNPKELSEFRFYCNDYVPFYMNGCDNVCGYYENGECKNGYIPLKRPPQSWCYVESLEGTE